MSFFVKITDLDRLATSGEFQVLSDLLQLDHPSRVFLDLQQSDIASYRRENTDLIIEAVDGSQLKIANFYQTNGDCQLYLKGDDGGLMLAVLSPVDDSGSLFSQYVPLTEASPFESVEEETRVNADGSAVGDWWSDNWGLVTLGLLGLGAAGAAVGGIGGGGSSGGDTTAPPAPAIPSVSSDGSDAVSVGANTIIGDTQPTFSGSGAIPNDTIKLYEGTTVVGTDTVDANGNWSISPTLAVGAHNLTLTATDQAGNQSSSTAVSIKIDTDGTLNGTTGADLLVGGISDDILKGLGGSDTVEAGAGDDQIIISDTGFASIDGGADFDVLVLDAGISLDTVNVNSISNIERVDMESDTLANTVTVTADTVQAMTDGNNELQIVGATNDTLNASGAVSAGQTTTIGSIIFDHYTLGSTTLLVDEDIVVVT